MNKHLEPVFSLLLPELEKRGIEYWVFGGVGVAACVGEFVRENGDVDIFVREIDFEKAKAALYDLCSHPGLEAVPPREQDSKYKLEIKKEGKEIFSVIPVFLEKDLIRFKYPKKYGGDEIYSIKDLERTERNISGYRFFTPTERLIMQKFFRHLAARPEKLKRVPVRKDIAAISRRGEAAEEGWLKG